MKDAASSPTQSPGGKKLVQARLPFKVVSPASPAIPPSRKRKLSQSNESASKITKPSKENDVEEDAVVISDDDAETRPGNNPLFKIADKALKKKLRQKAPKKDKNNLKAQKARIKKFKKNKSDKGDKKQAIADNDVTIVEEPGSGIEGISKLPNGELEDVEMSEADVELPLEVIITENENNCSSDNKRSNKSSSQTSSLKGETVEITEELSEEATSKEEEVISSNSPKADQTEKFEAQSTEYPKEDTTNQITPTNDQTSVTQQHEKAEDSVSIFDNKNFDSSNSDDDVTIIDNEESSENTEPMDNELSTPSTKNKHLETCNSMEIQLAVEALEPNNLTPKRRSARTKISPKESGKTKGQTYRKTDTSMTDVTTPKQNVKRSLAATSTPTNPANAGQTPKQVRKPEIQIKPPTIRRKYVTARLRSFNHFGSSSAVPVSNLGHA